MRRFTTFILGLILTIPLFAGTKLVSGNLSELIGARAIPVYVNWDSATYEKNGNLADFLSTAIRDDDWEKASLEYLLTRADAQTVEYGVRLTSPQDTTSYKYKMDVMVQSISKNGTIQGIINVVSVNCPNPIAVIEFKSDDADNNDKIAFRDQFKSLGKSLGKLLTEQFSQKSSKKNGKNSNRKYDDFDPIYN